MYILLDRSASMLEPTAAGVSKWDAIRAALEAFVVAPGSQGLGVGIQYFPLFKPGVPATCKAHADCGAGGPCFLSACDNQSTLAPCSTSSDCRSGGHCVPFGRCDGVPPASSAFCEPLGSPCGPGQGQCSDFPGRWCVNGVECSRVPYATPDVAIVALPAGAQQIVASIERTKPKGNTPTAPALAGAVAHARAWATGHSGHRVVAVLATDGLPTECDPTNIGQVAQLAQAGVTGASNIPTFVIGVFGPTDVASPTNLDTIASAGGTGRSFIVDTNADVTTEFQAALTEIRGSALLSCDIKVPDADPTAPLDFARVNLQMSEVSGASHQLAYVKSPGGCAAAPDRGWYYDADPATGAPTRMTVCPDVCRLFRSSVGATLNLQIGCLQIVR
jgi:hypothetical protein